MSKLKIFIGVIIVIMVLVFALRKLEKFYEPEPLPVVFAPEEAPVVKEESVEAKAQKVEREKARKKAFALARKKRTPAEIIKDYASDQSRSMVNEKEYKMLGDAVMDYVLCTSIVTRNPKYCGRFKLLSRQLGNGTQNTNIIEDCYKKYDLLRVMHTRAIGKLHVDVDTCVKYCRVQESPIKVDTFPDEFGPEEEAAVRSFCEAIVHGWSSSGGMNTACKNAVTKGLINETQCRLIFPMQASDCGGNSDCLMSLRILKAFQMRNSRHCRNSFSNSCRALIEDWQKCSPAAGTLSRIYKKYRIRKVVKEFGIN